MPRLKKPSIKQKLTFNALLESIKVGKPLTTQKAMLKGGFSPNTALNPEKNLLSKEGFQTLLNRIDDSVILARVNEILVEGANRESLQAADMFLKLKDRYPAQKSKIIGLFDTIKNLEEDEQEN